MLTRLPCTCAPGPRFLTARCPACQAWERRTCLLTDGTTIPQQHWIDASTVPMAIGDPHPNYAAYHADEGD